MSRNRAQRLAQQRQANAPVKPDAKAQVAQINEIIQSAKGIWFGLLTYLAFVGVTLMGVQDADFFLPDRDTHLPLIGVSVRTGLFFAISPTIGALIYAYFHMQLLKLWEALDTIDPTIDGSYVSDHIKPWLVADMCLSYRNDNALRPRPLAWISNRLNFMIVFWGTPLVLFAIWWSSAAPHIDWLTMMACGIPLTFTLFVGMNSWHSLRRLAKRGENDQTHLPRSLKGVFAFTAVIILTWGWLRVEGTLKYYAIYIGSLSVTDLPFMEPNGPPRWVRAKKFEKKIKNGPLDWEFMKFLPSADLVNVDFAQVSDNWLSMDWFRAEHRTTWCRSFDLPVIVCDAFLDLYRPTPTGSIPPMVDRIRTKWCQEFFGDDASDFQCDALFYEYKNRFENDWRIQRILEVNAVQQFDFSNADLRRSWLAGAQLQNANLSNALLQGATLEGAELENAYLASAQLQSAYLKGANLQSANLTSAQMQSSGLEEAQLQNANLTDAQLQGALLWKTEFAWSTMLTNTNFRGAALKDVDLTQVRFTDKQIKEVFGDASVRLPNDVSHDSPNWPEHWAQEELDFDTFVKGWREFQSLAATENELANQKTKP